MRESKTKMTDLGLLPEDWTLKYIKRITDIVTGATPSTAMPSYWNNGHIPWMSSGELNDKMIYDVKGRITQDGYDQSGTHLIPKHCVLVGLAGQGKTRGTAAYNHIELCTNQSIAAILPNDLEFDSLYLYYYFDSIYSELRQMSAGDGGRGGLNKQILLNLQVPIPPLDEQHKIARALRDMDSLLSSLTKLIEKKRNIKTATMQLLLTGEKRLSGYTDPWVERKLGDMLSYEQPSNYLVRSSKYVDGGTPVLTAGKTFILGYTNESFGVYNNLPVIIFDDFTTDSRFVTFPFKAKSSAMKMLKANNGFDLRLVYELLQMIDYTPGDHQRHWISMFADFSILVPPTMEEQIAIANICSDMDNEISSLEQKRAKYVAIKKGMMQELLTGKIRLV